MNIITNIKNRYLKFRLDNKYIQLELDAMEFEMSNEDYLKELNCLDIQRDKLNRNTIIDKLL